MDVINSDIIPCVHSDHAAFVITIGHAVSKRGPSYWKFNNSLLHDENYITLVNAHIPGWIHECGSDMDVSGLWDYLKYKIKVCTIKFGKNKADERKNKIAGLENELQNLETLLVSEPSDQNKAKFEKISKDLQLQYNYITEGSIVRARADAYEFGDKNNQYFLSLEKHNYKKSNITQLINTKGDVVTSSDKIMKEIREFYTNLYTSNPTTLDSDNNNRFICNDTIPKLDDTMRESCEGVLTQNETFVALQCLTRNRTPGNDGLSPEFYITFWPIIGKIVTNSLNAAYLTSRLSNSQRQGVITLIEKKGKEKRRIENWRPITLLNTDYKIASKCISMRIEKHLDTLVHETQTAFIKNRQIADGIRV